MPRAISPLNGAVDGPPPDGRLGAWIAALRRSLERGELAGLPPIDLGYGTAVLSAETTVRVMLADLDHHAELARARRSNPETASRHRLLLADLRRLRLLLG